MYTKLKKEEYQTFRTHMDLIFPKEIDVDACVWCHHIPCIIIRQSQQEIVLLHSLHRPSGIRCQDHYVMCLVKVWRPLKVSRTKF